VSLSYKDILGKLINDLILELGRNNPIYRNFAARSHCQSTGYGPLFIASLAICRPPVIHSVIEIRYTGRPSTPSLIVGNPEILQIAGQLQDPQFPDRLKAFLRKYLIYAAKLIRERGEWPYVGSFQEHL
jgi:hypothetical protein